MSGLRSKSARRSHPRSKLIRTRANAGCRIEALEGRRLLSGELVNVTAPDFRVGEGLTGTCRFLFSRDAAPPTPLTVHYALSGTATNGADYQLLNVPGPLSGVFVIPANASADSLTLESPFDNLLEGDETITVTIVPDPSYTIVSPSNRTATILDSPVGTPQSVPTPEDAAAVVTLSGANSYGFDMTYAVSKLPAHGQLYDGATPITSGSFASPYALSGAAVRYEPAADYNGPDAFDFRPRDATGPGDRATVSLDVTEVNDAPAGVDDNDVAIVDEDSPGVAISFAALLANDSTGPANEGGQGLTITAVGSAVGGAASIVGGDVVFTPAAGYSGPASFVYTLQDDGTTGGAPDPKTATASASLTITPGEDAPVARDDSYTTQEDTPLVVGAAAGALANDCDADHDPLHAVLVSGPDHGELSFNADGSFTYTPDEEFQGADAFTYKANDGQLDSCVAAVHITVNHATPGATMISDPCGDGSAVLIDGTPGNDTVLVGPAGAGGGYLVTLNGQSLGVFSPARFIIRTHEGDDAVQVAGTVATPAWAFGGSGDDHLNAGNASSVLAGGSGGDELLGGGGRDLLIGGLGGDHVVGNAGDDILIAGRTGYDRDLQAICRIMDEWTRTDAGFAARVAHLMGGPGGSNGGIVLTEQTVADDHAIDQIDLLNGSAGDDWFLYSLGGGDRAVGVSKTEAGAAVTSIS